MWGVKQTENAYRPLRIQVTNIAHEYAHGFCDSILRGHGLNFLGIRPFETGDSLRRVDWKASSRLDDDMELVVREFSPERRPTVYVVADMDVAMEYPKAKALFAHALVEMYVRAAFALAGQAHIIGVSKTGIIASPPMDNSDDLELFFRQTEQPRALRQLRQPWKNLNALFAEWKPKNALIVFVSDLRDAGALPVSALNVIDRTRQNVSFTYVVLDEWSGFTPSANIVALSPAPGGEALHFDLREGGEFHQESLRFIERVTTLRASVRRHSMSVHTLPLTSHRPIQDFMRSWHKSEAARA